MAGAVGEHADDLSDALRVVKQRLEQASCAHEAASGQVEEADVSRRQCGDLTRCGYVDGWLPEESLLLDDAIWLHFLSL